MRAVIFLLGESLPAQVLSLRGSLELVYFCFMLFICLWCEKQAGAEKTKTIIKKAIGCKTILWLFRYRL
jgi:hypothetical protein